MDWKCLNEGMATERTTIVIALADDALSAQQLDAVRQLAPDRDVVVTRDREKILQLLPTVEIAAGGFPRDLLARAPKLRWLQQWSAGADWLMKEPETAALDFVLTNASGVHAVPISEHIMAYLFAFARALPTAFRAQQEKRWDELDRSVFELAGKSMLLIGVGRIGARTAEIASALGMRVIGVRRSSTENVPGVDSMHLFSELPELLVDADFVVLTVPYTSETHHMIGAQELARMKRGSFIINIGRGGTIDEAALLEALDSGHIAGAGLDVFEEEPLPADSPFWTSERVIITAHYSGSTPEYNNRGFDIFIENLRRWAAGEPLQNVVDKVRGY